MHLHAGLHEVSAADRFALIIRRRRLLLFAAVTSCGFFVFACILTALTKLPYVDEGTFGGSAVNIVRTGFSGNPSTPPWGLGIPLEQSTHYNFWVMPAYLYTLAAWFRVAPQTILSDRVLSIIFGVIALVLFYHFIRLLGGSRTLATFSFVLLATDFNMILRSSVARMDSMSLMLNLSAWVAYLTFRRRSPAVAVFLSAALAALSFVTHPNGIIAFAGIVILAFLLDRPALSLRMVLSLVAGAAIPSAIAASLILQAPAVWLQQVRSHTVHRFAGLEHPLTAIWEEFLNRYYWSFGGVGFGSPLDSRYSYGRMLLLLVLLAYSIGTVCMFAPRYRRTLLGKASLGTFVITAIYFTFFETGKLVVYNIHLLPFFCLFLASLALSLFRMPKARSLTRAVIAGVFLINFASTFVYARADHYRSSYLPTLNLLRKGMGPNDLVLTHAYFGFELGFNRVTEDFTLVDIVRRKPLYVTMDHWFRISATAKTYRFGPDPVTTGMISQREKDQAVELLKTKYRVVLKTPDFAVYRKIAEF